VVSVVDSLTLCTPADQRYPLFYKVYKYKGTTLNYCKPVFISAWGANLSVSRNNFMKLLVITSVLKEYFLRT
jgi:hypothetical protein